MSDKQVLDIFKHWGRDKTAAIADHIFQMHILGSKLLYLETNFTEVCS